MLSHSRGNSPTSLNKIIRPDDEVIDITRRRGVRINEANAEAATFIEEWSKDGLLARATGDDAEFTKTIRNRRGRAEEWEHLAFTMTAAESEAWSAMSQEDKDRFEKIIVDTIRTDPDNPAAKRAVAVAPFHTNTKHKHIHLYAHAHLINYGTGSKPEVLATVINNNSFANTVNDALRFNLIEAGFDFIQLREQPMIGQSVEATDIDLGEKGNAATNLVNTARDMSPQTLAIEKLLEESQRKMQEEAEKQQLLMNALSFSTQNAELEKEVGKLNKQIEERDEQIEELKTDFTSQLETTKEELKNEFKSSLKEQEENHNAQLAKLEEEKQEMYKVAEGLGDELVRLKPQVAEANKKAADVVENAKKEIKKAKAETKQAQGLVATLQTALSTVQDTVKETYTSQIEQLERLITEGSLDDLMLYRNKNSKLSDPQKIVRGEEDVDYMSKYVAAFDTKLEAKKDTKDNKDTPKPNKP